MILSIFALILVEISDEDSSDDMELSNIVELISGMSHLRLRSMCNSQTSVRSFLYSVGGNSSYMNQVICNGFSSVD